MTHREIHSIREIMTHREIIAGMVRKMHCQPSLNHPVCPKHAHREINLRMGHSPYSIPLQSLLRTLIFFFCREMTAAMVAMVIKANPERAHGAHARSRSPGICRTNHFRRVYCIASHSLRPPFNTHAPPCW